MQAGKDTDLDIFQFNKTEKIKADYHKFFMTDEEEEDKAVNDADKMRDMQASMELKYGK